MRRRFVDDPKTGKLVEVTSERVRAHLNPNNFVRYNVHFKTTDGVEITSRKKREEYMRRNNLVEYEYQAPRKPNVREKERAIASMMSDMYEKRRDLARARGERFFGRR